MTSRTSTCRIADRQCLFPTTSGWRNARPLAGSMTSSIKLKATSAKTRRRSPIYNCALQHLRMNCSQLRQTYLPPLPRRWRINPSQGCLHAHLFNLELVHHPVLEAVCSLAHRLIPKHWGAQNQHPIPKTLYPWVCLIKGKGALHPILPLETHL